MHFIKDWSKGTGKVLADTFNFPLTNLIFHDIIQILIL